MRIQAPYLSEDDLRRRAEEFLDGYHPDRTIPVPIEEIVEFEFGMDIIPVPGLQDYFDTIAFIAKDLSAISVDAHVMEHRLSRYRFSLAHELAHRVLHNEVFSQIEFSDTSSWKDVIANIPEREYGFLEWHADSFAGLVLVPRERLREAFSRAAKKAKDFGIEIDGPARGTIEGYIAQEFAVSPMTIHIRMERDQLWVER